MIGPALRELAALLTLGVPLGEALEAVRPAGEPAWQGVIDSVRRGSSLGQALAPLNPCLGKATEDTLPELARTLDEEQRARAALHDVVQYPRWLAFGTLLLIWVLAALLQFSFWPLIEGLSMMLPDETVRVYRALPFFVLLATFVLGSLMVAPGQLLWYAGWSRNLELASWLRWVDSLTATGTPLPDAVKLVPCPELAGLDADLARGDSLADALHKRPGLKRLAWLVERAEKNGFQRFALRRISNMLTREMEMSLYYHLRLLEPLAVMTLAGLIGMVVIVGFLPMYQLIGNLG